jgi:hypothetical protein
MDGQPLLLMVRSGQPKPKTLCTIGETMLVKLTELFKPPGERMQMTDIYISPKTVQSIRPETSAYLNEARQLGYGQGQDFSRVTISEEGYSRSIIVVGSPTEVRQKLSTRQLLRD